MKVVLTSVIVFLLVGCSTPMKTARVWNGDAFVPSTPINGSLASAPLGEIQPKRIAKTNGALSVAATSTSRQPSLNVLPAQGVIFVRPTGAEPVKAFSPAPTVIESVTPSATALSQKLSAPLTMELIVRTADLVKTAQGDYYLQTQFHALVRNDATGQLVVNDVCSAKDGKAYPLNYFKDKFAIALNRHLESHANRCATKHISVIERVKA